MNSYLNWIIELKRTFLKIETYEYIFKHSVFILQLYQRNFQYFNIIKALANKHFSPINPAKDLWIILIRRAECDAICPILSQSMFFRDCFESRCRYGHLHGDVGFVRTHVVSPKCGQWFVHAAFAFGPTYKKQGLQFKSINLWSHVLLLGIVICTVQ